MRETLIRSGVSTGNVLIPLAHTHVIPSVRDTRTRAGSLLRGGCMPCVAAAGEGTR